LFTLAESIVLSVACAVLGGALVALAARRGTLEALRGAEQIAAAARREARQTIERAALEGGAVAERMRQEAGRIAAARRQRLHRYKRRLFALRAAYRSARAELDETRRELERRAQAIATREKEFDHRKAELDQAIRDKQEALSRLAGMGKEEACRRLREELRGEVRAEAAWEIQRQRELAAQRAQEEARHVIVAAIERCSAPHTAEHTVAVVPLSDEALKGRVIGRDGRNIRAFESATGVDLLIDDQPDCLVLSAYDPVKREIARRSLGALIENGRITPETIDQVVEGERERLTEVMLSAAREVIDELEIGPVDPELVGLLGRLRFRTSYTQNVLNHSREVALLADRLATELGLPYSHTLCRRAGLFHDVGKAIDRAGTHAAVGAQTLRRCGEDELVAEAVGGHHDDPGTKSPLVAIVAAADAISGSRPGARRQSAAQHIDRLTKLEELGARLPGVERCYAVQAGREVRVLVHPNEVDDRQARILAGDLAHRIAEEIRFPGEIKVTVIRETKAVTYAH